MQRRSTPAQRRRRSTTKPGGPADSPGDKCRQGDRGQESSDLDGHRTRPHESHAPEPDNTTESWLRQRHANEDPRIRLEIAQSPWPMLPPQKDGARSPSTERSYSNLPVGPRPGLAGHPTSSSCSLRGTDSDGGEEDCRCPVFLDVQPQLLGDFRVKAVLHCVCFLYPKKTNNHKPRTWKVTGIGDWALARSTRL